MTDSMIFKSSRVKRICSRSYIFLRYLICLVPGMVMISSPCAIPMLLLTVTQCTCSGCSDLIFSASSRFIYKILLQEHGICTRLSLRSSGFDMIRQKTTATVRKLPARYPVHGWLARLHFQCRGSIMNIRSAMP